MYNNPFNGFSDDDIDEILKTIRRSDTEEKLEKEIVCECGSEKTYGQHATHSDWCPKYKE